jgi:hypothetical protein
VFLPGVPTHDMSQLRAAAALRGPFDLVTIDTSAAYFPGDDENKNTQLGDHAREMRKFTRRRRIRHARMGGLVQQPPAIGANRQRPTCRSGSELLRDP